MSAESQHGRPATWRPRFSGARCYRPAVMFRTDNRSRRAQFF